MSNSGLDGEGPNSELPNALLDRMTDEFRLASNFIALLARTLSSISLPTLLYFANCGN